MLKVSSEVLDFSFLNYAGWAVLNINGGYEIPFLDRMFIVFVVFIFGMVFISLANRNRMNGTTTWQIDTRLFKVNRGFAEASYSRWGY